MENKEFDVIDEVPTKEQIIAVISGCSSAGKEKVTTPLNNAKIEQHTVNDVIQPENDSILNNSVLQHGTNKIAQNNTFHQMLKSEEKRLPDSLPVKQGIVRDIKGRIVKPVAQETNKNGKAGRKPAINEEVMSVLRQAYLMGATDEEAAEFADISRSTLSKYKTEHPEFSDEIEAWKTNPIMKARSTVYNSLNDPRIAAWFLERKKKDEFSTRTEHTGKDGEDLPPMKIEYVTPTDTARVSKSSIRTDNETASGMDALNGSDDQ